MQPADTFAVDPEQRRRAFDWSDSNVLFCGIAAALFQLAYPYVIDEKRTPWDRQWILAFSLLWSWLLPLAGGLLADMRSARRWTAAILVYAIALFGLPHLERAAGGWRRAAGSTHIAAGRQSPRHGIDTDGAGLPCFCR